MEQHQPDFGSWFKIFAAAIFLYWSLHNIEMLKNGALLLLQVFAPFILGITIAFIINIPMKFTEHILYERIKIPMPNKLKRPIALLLTLSFLIGMMAIVMVSVVPELSATFQLLKNNLPQYFDSGQAWLEQVLITWQFKDALAWVQSLKFDWNRFLNTATDLLQTSLGGIFSSTVTMITSFFSGMLVFVLGMVFAMYMLFQKETLRDGFISLLCAYAPPKVSREVLEIFELIQSSFSSFISGQFLEALILGSMFFVSMLIFRFSYALAVSMFIGLFSLLPVFGAFLGFLIGFFLILLVNPAQALWFGVLFFVIQQIEGNFIYPKLMSDRIGLPPIGVLLAVTIGGSLLGVLGILLFTPTASVLYILAQRQVQRKLEEKEFDLSLFTHISVPGAPSPQKEKPPREEGSNEV